MYLNTVFCSHLFNHEWLQKILIPCPFKALTGIDCPGCGFQRAVVHLMQGQLMASLKVYPATIPIVLWFIIGLIGPKHQSPVLYRMKLGLGLIAVITVTTAYLLKLGVYLSH